MMERYPFFESGKLAGYVRAFSDFVEVMVEDRLYLYLWEKDCGFLHSGGGSFLRAVYEPPLDNSAGSAVDLEARVREAAQAVGDKLRGRRVMVDFSGGKDSTLNLLAVAMLSELVGFRAIPVYVHVPYLEPPSSIDYAERVAGRLGLELEVVEADRRMMLFYLNRDGLPRRGTRWCTFLKMKALREAMKAVGADIEAKAERIAESGKRAEKLSKTFAKTAYLAGKTLNLVYDMPIEQVALELVSRRFVHPHYLEGLPRVSCSLCPYKGLYELAISREHKLEDWGLVEHSVKRLHQRYYHALSWEEYWSYALWRYDPTVALMRAREVQRIRSEEELSLERAKSMFSSLWREENLKALRECASTAPGAFGRLPNSILNFDVLESL